MKEINQDKESKKKRRKIRNEEIIKFKTIFPQLNSLSKNQFWVNIHSDKIVELGFNWDYNLSSPFFPDTYKDISFSDTDFAKPAKDFYNQIVNCFSDMTIEQDSFKTWVTCYIPDIPIRKDEFGNRYMDFDNDYPMYDGKYLAFLKERKDLFQLQQDKDIDEYYHAVQIGFDTACCMFKFTIERDKLNALYKEKVKSYK